MTKTERQRFFAEISTSVCNSTRRFITRATFTMAPGTRFMWMKSTAHNARPSSWWIGPKQTNADRRQRPNECEYVEIINGGGNQWENEASQIMCARSRSESWHNVTKDNVISLQKNPVQNGPTLSANFPPGHRGCGQIGGKGQIDTEEAALHCTARQSDPSSFTFQESLIRLAKVQHKAFFSPGLEISIDCTVYRKLSLHVNWCKWHWQEFCSTWPIQAVQTNLIGPF